jgi:sigma-B regulation protein RsbU (phosphoserine phosphatase)
MTPQGSLLIVDDDVRSRNLLRGYLTPHGLTITEAEDGTRALELIEQSPFDLVLLDVQMPPGPSGFEVLETLRRTCSATDLPVIMATAANEGADVVRALGAGANDYVTKPFDFPVVLARVRTQLELKAAVDRSRRLEQSLARRNAELEAVNRTMKRDLDAAARVQQALLPRAQPAVTGARFAWVFRPCVELAGDLLNVLALDEHRVCLYVLDVVGHGVKAALLAVMVSRVLARLLLPAAQSGGAAGQVPPPAEVAAHLNREFPWDDQTQQFFTLLYGVLDLGTGMFCFVSAGHPGPLYLPQGAEAQALSTPGVPIGLGEGYEERWVRLRKGERLYLYSDGAYEVMNAEHKGFGEERLHRVLAEGRNVPLQEGLDRLTCTLEEWCAPAAPHDDISVLAVELT